MTQADEKHVVLSRKLVFGWLITSVAAMVVLFAFVLDVSYEPTFRRIELGAPRGRVLNELESVGAYCGDLQSAPDPSSCVFADPWRKYIIRFNPTGEVSQKMFWYRNRQTLLGRTFIYGRWVK